MIMNISTLTTGLAVCSALILSSCSINSIANSNVSIEGNNDELSVQRSVKIGDFNEIEASQAIKVVFVQGPNNGVASISTTTSADKYLRVEVKDKTLKAYYTNTNGLENVKIKGPSIIKVSSPELNEVDLSSAANVTIEGDLNSSGKLEIDLSSASSFNASKISCQKLAIDFSSSASAYIGELTGFLDAELSSASSFEIGSIKGNVDVEASSAASMSVNSLSSSAITADASSASSIKLSGISGGAINATASSGAKINLSGKAKSLNHEASSGAKVNHKDLYIVK